MCTITPSPLGTLGFDGQNDADITLVHDLVIAGVVVVVVVVVVAVVVVLVMVVVVVVVALFL